MCAGAPDDEAALRCWGSCIGTRRRKSVCASMRKSKRPQAASHSRNGRGQRTCDCPACERSAIIADPWAAVLMMARLMLAFVFPGQGAQSRKAICVGSPRIARAKATSMKRPTGSNVEVLSLDTAEALRIRQSPCRWGWWSRASRPARTRREGLTAEVSAGLSVGAYAAAVSCGAVGFRDALKLVRRAPN